MNKRTIYPLALLVLSVLSLHPGANDLLAATTKGESCVTGKCHNKMGKASYVHGPVAAGECAFCHKQVGKHKFQPVKDVGSLCYQCHDKRYTGKSLHAPVKSGDCTRCHDPHQSPTEFLLKGDGSSLCFNCHDAAPFQRKFVHGPVTLDDCGLCHDPHASDFPNMLMSEGNEACFSCHTDQQAEFAKKPYIHDPAAESCVACHDPHSSDYQFGLANDGRQELCYACHQDMQEQIAATQVTHKGIATEKRCLACHDPHTSDYTMQLTAQPMVQCMQCHDRAYKNATGNIANIKAILDANSNHHGPIRQNDCSGCHDPHGSANFRILREYFPRRFYAPYNPDNYQLCFMCHQNTIAETEKTTTLTNFRNGDWNLHFLHVNRSKGRTCRACHAAHASNNPGHIRDAVPYGSWSLPINITLTPNGGKCSPGCHQPFSYDRIKAIPNR